MRFARCRPTVSPPGNTGPSAGRTIGPVRAADAILIGVGGVHVQASAHLSHLAYQSYAVALLPTCFRQVVPRGAARVRQPRRPVRLGIFSASPAVIDGLPPLSLRLATRSL